MSFLRDVFQTADEIKQSQEKFKDAVDVSSRQAAALIRPYLSEAQNETLSEILEGLVASVVEHSFQIGYNSAMPVVNLSYILEESNIDKHYKRVIMDLDPSYWDDDHKGTFGTDTNLLFRLTGNRWITYVEDLLVKDNYNDTIADYNFSKDNIKKIPKNIECKFSREYITGEESFMQNTYNSVVLGTTDRYKYLGRGFRYGLKKSGVEWPKFDFSTDNIKQENTDAFKKIVKYCKDNDIELVCVQSALPPYRLQNENIR